MLYKTSRVTTEGMKHSVLCFAQFSEERKAMARPLKSRSSRMKRGGSKERAGEVRARCKGRIKRKAIREWGSAEIRLGENKQSETELQGWAKEWALGCVNPAS